MKIVRLRVRNFKGIKDSGWLELDDLNAIVGKNDAGKSSVLLAINEFYNGSKLAIEDRYLDAGDNKTSFEVILDGNEIEQIPKVLLDERHYLHIRKEAAEANETYKTYIIVNDFENIAYQNLFQQTTAKIKSVSHRFELEAPDKITMDYLELLFDLISPQETNYCMQEYELKATILKDYLRSLYPQFSLFLADTNLDTAASSFQNQFRRIVTSAIESHLDSVRELQSNISEAMNSEISIIKEYMGTHYAGIDELKPDISYDWSKLVNFDVIMKDSSGYEINLSNKGTGIQRLFMVSYFQYLATKSTDDNSSYIFAIEEPETFLHPGAQRQLLDSLKIIAESHQVILTTHSPVFASEINNRNITVVVKENRESKYLQGNTVSSEQLVDELGVRAHDSIISSRLLVFVEGSGDIRFWDVVYRKVTGHSYQDDGILFVPGGGSELHNIAEMNLMSKLNRNFLVIVDKDAGAVDYDSKLAKQERLKELVESKGGQLFVLRKREIENYYSADVVKTMLGEKGLAIETLTIGDYEDVQRKLKLLFNGRNVMFKIKNNMDVFNRMSIEDFRKVSSYYVETEQHYELEEIIEAIRSRL